MFRNNEYLTGSPLFCTNTGDRVTRFLSHATTYSCLWGLSLIAMQLAGSGTHWRCLGPMKGVWDPWKLFGTHERCCATLPHYPGVPLLTFYSPPAPRSAQIWCPNLPCLQSTWISTSVRVDREQRIVNPTLLLRQCCLQLSNTTGWNNGWTVSWKCSDFWETWQCQTKTQLWWSQFYNIMINIPPNQSHICVPLLPYLCHKYLKKKCHLKRHWESKSIAVS